MNPLAATKCAGRLLMALTAFASILLIASCGSSGSGVPTPNSGGFNNGSLSGTYVLSISGADFRSGGESFFAIVGTIKADGKGNITGGTIDINNANLGGTGVFQETLSPSTYSITADGRGTSKLLTSVGDFGLDFVLTSTGHGLVTRFDIAGSGSGTLDLQNSASQSSLGPLAFSLSGVDSGGNPLGTVGAFALNSSGAITSGTQDFNDNGSSAGSSTGPADLATTSSLVLTSSTQGTAQLDSTFGSLGFDVWVIDSTHLKFIETDTTSGVALSGDAFTQQTSFAAGQLVFTLAGLDSAKNPFAAGGYVTTSSGGTLSSGVEDYNDAGITGTQTNVAGSCTTFVAGRCQLAVTGFSNGIAQALLQFAAYPSSGGVLLLEDDSLGLLQGTAFAQTATSFAAPAGYALNLSGVNANPIFGGSAAEVDDIAQFNTSAATANMRGVLNENDLTAPCPNPTSGCYALLGTYTPDSPVTGRGSIIAVTSGSLVGGLSLEYYVVDGSTMLFVEGDSSQVAVGTFQAQSASGSGGAAQSRIAILHPAVRPQGALRSK